MSSFLLSTGRVHLVQTLIKSNCRTATSRRDDLRCSARTWQHPTRYLWQFWTASSSFCLLA